MAPSGIAARLLASFQGAGRGAVALSPITGSADEDHPGTEAAAEGAEDPLDLDIPPASAGQAARSRGQSRHRPDLLDRAPEEPRVAGQRFFLGSCFFTGRSPSTGEVPPLSWPNLATFPRTCRLRNPPTSEQEEHQEGEPSVAGMLRRRQRRKRSFIAGERKKNRNEGPRKDSRKEEGGEESRK